MMGVAVVGVWCDVGSHGGKQLLCAEGIWCDEGSCGCVGGVYMSCG